MCFQVDDAHYDGYDKPVVSDDPSDESGVIFIDFIEDMKGY